MEQQEVQGMPPPRQFQDVVPIYPLEMYDQEIESNEVETDVHNESKTSQRTHRSYVPE